MIRQGIKINLLAGVACAALSVVAVPALAADAGAATAAQAQGTEVGDIVVTARRTEERLQDVPISMTVLNQTEISKQNIIWAGDLATYVPSLTVNQEFGVEKATFVIRGFVQEDNTAPSVGVYFADVVSPRAYGGTASGNTAAVGSFMDLQNVQVLKGPQGTLFGLNTTGGAVLLVPNRPTDKYEGWIEGSLGDYDMRRLQGVINFPVSDKLKIRVALDRDMTDGYTKNFSGIGSKDYNNVNYFAGRISILWNITPTLENYTIASYSNSHTFGAGGKVVACNPNATAFPANLFSASACAQIQRDNAAGQTSPLDVDINNPDPFIKLRQWQVINTTTWEARDDLTIKNIFSYAEFRELDEISIFDDDFTVSNNPPPLIPGLPFPPGKPYQFVLLGPAPDGRLAAAESTLTDEFQFQGKAFDGRLTWQAGAFMDISLPLGFNASNTASLINCTDTANLICTNPLFIGNVNGSTTLSSYHDYAGYAQATYKLTRQLSLTGGVRYTSDFLYGTDETVKNNPLPFGSYVPTSYYLTCQDIVDFHTGTLPNISPLIVANQSQCAHTSSAKSSAPTYVIDVDYKPVDDLLLYAKYSRGYRAGGLNLAAVGLQGWQPEHIDAYEAGAKWSFRGPAPGYFDIAGFYNDLSNQQITALAIPSNPAFTQADPIINAGKSRIEGVEIESAATFFDRLRVDVGYTYLYTKLLQINTPALPAGSPYASLDAEATVGGPLTYAPSNRATISVTYSLPVPESLGQISVGGTFVHTDRQLFNTETLPSLQDMPETDLLNLNANWNHFLGKPIDVSFYMTNVTNLIYPIIGGGAYFTYGYEKLIYGQPRMWGFRLRYNFG